MKLKIKGRIYVTVISIVLLICSLFSVFFLFSTITISVNNMDKEIEANADFYQYMMDNEYPGAYEEKDGMLYKNNVSVTQMHIIQELNECTGYDYTIFYQDVRILTTIGDGEKLIGTKSDSHVAETVLKQAQTLNESLRIEGKPYYTHYEPIKDASGATIGMLFIGKDVSDNIDGIMKNLIFIFVSMLVLVIISILATTIVAGRISRRILGVSKHIDSLRDKDFTQKISSKLLSCYDETGDMSRSVNQMQEDISSTLQEINALADDVNEEAASLSDLSGEMSRVTENITHTVQGVTQGTVEQAEDLVKINEIAKILGEGVNHVRQAVTSIDEQSDNINKVAAKGNDEIKQVMRILEDFANHFADYMDKMQSFEKNMNKIDEIIVTIESISRQTNLLALNAAIEAARAGEMGKGFSVVAEEIRSLAEQSQLATQNISSIIQNVSEDTKELMTGTVNMNTQLDAQTESLNQMIESFEAIIMAVQNILPQIKAASKEANILDKQKETILVKIENSSAIAQEVSASCEEVYASSEEMNTSTAQVDHSATILKDKVSELKKKIQLFKVHI